MKTNTLFTLLKKDFKLTLRNKTILVLFVIPIVFAIVYPMMMQNAEVGEQELSSMLIIMISILGLSTIGGTSVGTSIAEEKEKKTMRSLTLSNVSGLQFLISKIIVTLSLFTIIMVVCFFLLETPISWLPFYLAILIPTAFSLVLVGAVVGLLAENQQAVGVLAMPLMILALIPMFTFMMEGDIPAMLTKIAPTGPFVSMLTLYAGEPLLFAYSYTLGIISIVVWIVIGLIIFAVFFKKKQNDN